MRAQAARVPAEGGHLGKGPGRRRSGSGARRVAALPRPGAQAVPTSPSPSPPPLLRSPAPRRQDSTERVGGREPEEKKGSADYLTLFSAGSWAGWVAWGGEKGRGRGRGKGGSPCEL